VPLVLSVSPGSENGMEYETSVKIRERDPDEFTSSYQKIRSIEVKHAAGKK